MHFSYGFSDTQRHFDEINCHYHSILTFPDLLKEAQSMQILSNEQIESLHIWHQDPFKWAGRKGFNLSHHKNMLKLMLAVNHSSFSHINIDIALYK